MNKIERRITHLFRSGVLYTGVDHFLAMFPATVLVPILIKNKFDLQIIDISLVLLASGVGTLLFLLLTRGKIPAYLGSSFAYIGLTSYLISNIAAENNIEPPHAYMYLMWGYLFAAILLFIFSFAYRFEKTIGLMNLLFPSSVIGPAISLIGLELASVAAIDAGFSLPKNDPNKFASMTIAFTTLGVIILASITRRSFLKNASIIIGFAAGYVVSLYFDFGKPINFSNVPTWSIPQITLPNHLDLFPKNLGQLFLAVIPATVVLFAEHISRITVINRMQMIYNSPQDSIGSFKDIVQISLRGHAASVATSAIIGSVPTTIYAENIAVMSINSADSKKREGIHDTDPFITNLYNPLYFIPLVIGAIITITVSFLNIVQYFLINIPKPIIGGMELFLFGIIAAPGIQLLVENGVNFRKLTNQIITASVLVAGVSGFSFDFGIIELKGMSLGLLIGVLINLLFNCLKWFGFLNDRITFTEAVDLCLSDNTDEKIINCLYTNSNPVNDIDISNIASKELLNILRGQQIQGDRTIINRDLIHSNLKCAHKADVANLMKKVFVSVVLKTDGVYLYIKIPEEKANCWCHDYPESFSYATEDYFNVRLDGRIPNRKLKELLRDALLLITTQP